MVRPHLFLSWMMMMVQATEVILMYCSPYKINGLIFLSRDTYILLCNLLRQLSNSSDRYTAGFFLASFSTLDYCLLPFDLGSHVYCLLFAFFCLMSVLTQIYLTPEPQPSSSQGHDHGYHSRLPSCFTLLLFSSAVETTS